MSYDQIEQALHDEREITPSPGFSYRVMRSVRLEADQQRALPFPWKPLAAGLGIAAGLTVVGLLSSAMPAETAVAEPSPYLASALAWLSTALAGSLALAWWSFRFAGRS